jgi:hypothetical protein
MSVFKLPLGLCDDLTGTIRSFCWGVENGKRKMAWLAWEQMILKKCCGGMGFKDLRLFNQAMLARQAWRLVQFPDSLCARLLKAKCFPRGSLVDTAFCSNASIPWQAIMHGLELLNQGIIWRVANGKQIRTWRDPWIPRELSLRVTSRQGRCRLRWVSELLDIDGRGWDFNKLIQIFKKLLKLRFLQGYQRILLLGIWRKVVFSRCAVLITSARTSKHQALLRMVRGNCGRGSGGMKCLPKLMFSLGNWQGIYSQPGGQNS